MSENAADDTLCNDYPDPVGRLLAVGETDSGDPRQWRNYAVRYELTHDHIPLPIRMACDLDLHNGDGMEPGVWAPAHAWRALGQLGAAEAVEPLLASIETIHDTEAPYEDLIGVLGLIGPAAVPPVAAFLAAATIFPGAAAMATDDLREIVKYHPECRGECVEIMTGVLRRAADLDPRANGYVVASLLDLAAVEAIDTIREAFRLDVVDHTVAGDLEDVEIVLGFRERRSTPRRLFWGRGEDLPDREDIGGEHWEEDIGVEHREADVEPRPAKVGRNQPCPCGSGRKYKKCCLAASEE